MESARGVSTGCPSAPATGRLAGDRGDAVVVLVVLQNETSAASAAAAISRSGCFTERCDPPRRAPSCSWTGSARFDSALPTGQSGSATSSLRISANSVVKVALRALWSSSRRTMSHVANSPSTSALSNAYRSAGYARRRDHDRRARDGATAPHADHQRRDPPAGDFARVRARVIRTQHDRPLAAQDISPVQQSQVREWRRRAYADKGLQQTGGGFRVSSRAGVSSRPVETLAIKGAAALRPVRMSRLLGFVRSGSAAVNRARRAVGRGRLPRCRASRFCSPRSASAPPVPRRRLARTVLPCSPWVPCEWRSGRRCCCSRCGLLPAARRSA